MITLVLPVPPSTNNLFATAGRRRIKSQRYRDWLEEAGFYLMQQTFKQGEIEGAYEMRLRVPLKCRADVTNLFKAPEDLLVSIGVLPDDKHCFRASIERADVEDCEVTVMAVGSA